MINNDFLRSIRYILQVNDSKMVDILKLGDLDCTFDEMKAYLQKDDEPEFKECPHKVIAHFLNGLVIYKRGKDETRAPAPIEIPVTNNIVFKKLRVAFKLRDEDILAILQKNEIKITKSELSAFFRKVGHVNYREVGDQILRKFMKGLSK